MKRDLITSVLAVALFTLVLGIAYPLATTGAAQVLFPGRADGGQIVRNGETVGSRLIAQDFGGDRSYFQSRPSVTGYNPAGTFFNNLGPNSAELRDLFGKNLAGYLRRERRYYPDLEATEVPPDAIQTTASGVDPHISEENAAIQVHRVAAVRGLALPRVRRLVEENTDGRGLGVLGEPGVNVLELNLALDSEGA
jgi:potassium-transporting ATPase KdpC subunit